MKNIPQNLFYFSLRIQIITNKFIIIIKHFLHNLYKLQFIFQLNFYLIYEIKSVLMKVIEMKFISIKIILYSKK